MGYYTEFRCRVTLTEETPEHIIDILDSVINDYEGFYADLTGKPMEMMRNVSDTPRLPIDNKFGDCQRWDMLFHSNNFEPEKFFGSRFNKETRELDIYTEFKDYDDEIRLFCKWIRDWIDEDKDVEIWSRGEDYCHDERDNFKYGEWS